jgi:hypothetical protein
MMATNRQAETSNQFNGIAKFTGQQRHLATADREFRFINRPWPTTETTLRSLISLVPTNQTNFSCIRTKTRVQCERER